jgi:hypothetical protein
MKNLVYIEPIAVKDKHYAYKQSFYSNDLIVLENTIS